MQIVYVLVLYCLVVFWTDCTSVFFFFNELLFHPKQKTASFFHGCICSAVFVIYEWHIYGWVVGHWFQTRCTRKESAWYGEEGKDGSDFQRKMLHCNFSLVARPANMMAPSRMHKINQKNLIYAFKILNQDKNTYLGVWQKQESPFSFLI